MPDNETTCLKAIRLQNCQSWLDVTIPLSTELMNVIVAENSTGKSVIFKMLQATACPEALDTEDRENLIRRGKSAAQISFAFTDGATATTRVLKDRVLYFYKDPDDLQYKVYAKAPQKMLDNIGLIVEGDSGFVANIIDTDHDMLLVNSNLNSNNNLMEIITSSKELDDFRSLVDRKLDEFNNIKLGVQNYKSSLDVQLAECEYKDPMILENNIQNCEFLFDVGYKLVEVFEQFYVLSDSPAKYKSYDDLIFVANILQKIKSLKELFEDYHIPKPYKEDCLDLAEAGLLLKNIVTFSSVIRIPQCPKIDFLSTIDVLLAIKKSMNNLVTIKEAKDFSRLQFVTDSLGKLQILASVSKDLANSLKSKDTSACNMKSLKEKIKRANSVYSCAIYGEVMFDGKKCIPID